MDAALAIQEFGVIVERNHGAVPYARMDIEAAAPVAAKGGEGPRRHVIAGQGQRDDKALAVQGIEQLAAVRVIVGAPDQRPLAPPGDDVTPEAFVGFWCDGSRGLYIAPNVWHGAFVPHDDDASFLDRQGRVHARVSVDFPKEFGCYLAVPLGRPAE